MTLHDSSPLYIISAASTLKRCNRVETVVRTLYEYFSRATSSAASLILWWRMSDALTAKEARLVNVEQLIFVSSRKIGCEMRVSNVR